MANLGVGLTSTFELSRTNANLGVGLTSTFELSTYTSSDQPDAGLTSI